MDKSLVGTPARGRLGRKHDGIRAVEDRIGNVARLLTTPALPKKKNSALPKNK